MAFSGETAALYTRFLDGDQEVRDGLISHVDEHFKFVDALSKLSQGELEEYQTRFPDRFIRRVVSLGDGPGAPGLEVARKLRDQYAQLPVQLEVYSTDLSEDMSHQARQRAKEAGFDDNTGEEEVKESTVTKSNVSMKFVAPLSADDPVALRKHFPDGSVDVVLMSFVLMFVSDREICFAEVERMLRPGGKLVFCVLNQFCMIDVLGNALDEVLRDEDTNLKLCRPIRPVACLALKDWAVHEHNHIDGSDDEMGEGLEKLLMKAAPSLARGGQSYSIITYDFPLGCRRGEEEILLDMFCSLISDENWAAVAQRSPHLNGSLEQARKEVRDYVTAVVVDGNGQGNRNRWLLDDNGQAYHGDMYCCPDYAAPVVCLKKERDENEWDIDSEFHQWQ